MARRKGFKAWHGITTEGWLSLLGNTHVMTDLMMSIFRRLYMSQDYMGNAQNIARFLGLDYRSLNAGVGWAGNKIKQLAEEKKISLYTEEEEEEESLASETLAGMPKGMEKDLSEKMAPWEYVFDGYIGENGEYYWILKPQAVKAFREYADSDLSYDLELLTLLNEDSTAFGVEGSLFSRPSDETIDQIRGKLENAEANRRRAFDEKPICAVCGAARVSLLRSLPYGEEGKTYKGLVFCPTHGALFASHLISFNDKEELLISQKISKEEGKLYGLEEKMKAKTHFSHRRMAEHRKIFNQEERKTR